MSVRRVAGAWAGLTAGLALVVAGAAPAAAKGPLAATITSPPTAEHPDGVATALVPAGDPPAASGTVDPQVEPPPDGLLQLAEDMGLWDAIDPEIALPPEPPYSAGPAFPVEWTLVGPRGGEGFEQTLYPQAAGGPLVHTEAGQTAYGLAVPGGWYRASSRLGDTLESLGFVTKMRSAVTPNAADGETDTVAGGSAHGETRRDDPSPAATAVWWGPPGLLVVAGVVAGARVARRRLSGPTATTPVG